MGPPPSRRDYEALDVASRKEDQRHRRRGCACFVVMFGLFSVSVLHHALTTFDGELGPWTESDFASSQNAFHVPNKTLWRNADAPLPTGAWWLNAMIEGGSKAPVPAPPYQILTGDTGIMISYSSRRRVVSREAQIDQFGIDWFVMPQHHTGSFVDKVKSFDSWVPAGDALAGTSPVRARHLVSHSHLGAVIRYDPGVSVTMVKGSPMITFEVEDCWIVLAPGGASGGRINRTSHNDTVLTLADESRWLIVSFSSDYMPLPLTVIEEGVAVRGPGVVRLGFVPSDEDLDTLLESCPTTYARGGDVSFDKDTYTFHWDVVRDAECGSLTLLGQRHHRDLMLDSRGRNSLSPSGFVGSKGNMSWVHSPSTIWKIREPLFDLVDLRGYETTSKRRNDIADQAKRDVARLKAHATKQAKSDSYGYVYFQGKELARLARLAVVAADAGDDETSDRAVEYLRRRFEKFLRSSDQLMSYDTSWGGIVATQGDDPFANFGNALYSDHHFHYGYYAYAAAVLGDRKPLWARRWSRKLRSLINDFANIDNPRFPVARHKDWYESHSWATGLVVYATGKSQESSSEAVHAYLAVARFGKALGDARLMDWGKLLAATEIRGAQTYWHMHPGEGIYDDLFAQSRMAGSVSGTAVSATTWFGSNPEYVHGINVLPVLAGSTDLLFRPSYVCQQLSVLRKALDRSEPPVEEAWRGVILADVAVALPKTAWDDAITLDETKFDDGNSKANLLHYLDAVYSTTTDDDDDKCQSVDEDDDDDYVGLPANLDGVLPYCASNLACVALGLSGFCCPQADGYVFGCCPVLQPYQHAPAQEDDDSIAH